MDIYLVTLRVLTALGAHKTVERLFDRWMLTEHYVSCQDFADTQSVFPVCSECYLIIFRNQPHDGYCEEMITERLEMEKQEQADWEAYYAEQDAELARQKEEDDAVEEAYWASRCISPGCHNESVKDDLCQHHWDSYNLCDSCGDLIDVCRGECQSYLDEPDDWHEDDQEDDDDDYVTPAEVYRRAYAHFGNDEEAREAARLYPGDFI